MRIDKKARYYDAGGIEVITVVKAKLTPEQYKGYLLGTALVYQCRANFKEDFQRDIEKAQLYLEWLSELGEDEMEPLGQLAEEHPDDEMTIRPD